MIPRVIGQALLSGDAALYIVLAVFCLPFILAGIGVAWWIIRSGRMKDEHRLQQIRRTIHAVNSPSEPFNEERVILKNCSNCGDFCIHLPVRDQFGRTYCSQECMTAIAQIPIARQDAQSQCDNTATVVPANYCETCLKCTTEQGCWNLFTINGVGAILGSAKDQCPQCYSMRKTVYLTIFFIPILPLGTYRFLHIDRSTFYSRKILAK